MMRRVALPIGLAATLIICFQNLPFALGFGWALIHGAGAASFLAFLPTLIGLYRTIAVEGNKRCGE